MRADILNISLVGDLAPVKEALMVLTNKHVNSNDSFKSYFADSDILFGNLEVPVTTAFQARENKKYLFKSDPKVLQAFPEHFIFSIANNHILDYGNEGLLETIDHLAARGLRFTGAGKNIEYAGKPVIIECKGKKIGFLASADERYQSATENSPGTLPATADVLVPRIKHLREKLDILYVSIHLGMEYIPVPTPGMKNIADVCHSSGADVVFFHHAHCVSGYSLANGKATLWGLGNFLFPEKANYPFKPWFETAAWHIKHDLNTGNIELEIEPFIIDENGLPAKANEESSDKIISRVEKLSSAINSGKSLNVLRLKHILKCSYLKVVLNNYADIARRGGLKSLAMSVVSSFRVLFFKKGNHAAK